MANLRGFKVFTVAVLLSSPHTVSLCQENNKTGAAAESRISDKSWAGFLSSTITAMQKQGYAVFVSEDHFGNRLHQKFDLAAEAECVFLAAGANESLEATVRQPDSSIAPLGTPITSGMVYKIEASSPLPMGTYEVMIDYAPSVSERIALVVGRKGGTLTDFEKWAVFRKTVKAEFDHNGYLLVYDSLAATSSMSTQFSLAGAPRTELLMGWAVVSNCNSFDVVVTTPNGRKMPLGGGKFSEGFYVNMDFTPAVPGVYTMTAKTSGGTKDKLLMMIGSKTKGVP